MVFSCSLFVTNTNTMKRSVIYCFLLIIPLAANSQSLFDKISDVTSVNNYEIGGFVRGEFYYSDPGGSAKLSTGISYASIKLSSENGKSYKAYTDIRYRYGVEFGEYISYPVVKEAYVSWYTDRFELCTGQQIVKWSNSDFFKVQDRINPRDDLLRSFDDADRDLGNIMLNLKIYPSNALSIQALIMPFYRPSVLSTGLMEIPDIISINELPPLQLSGNQFNYGINTRLHFRNIDMSFSFMNAYNPLPGTGFESLIMPLPGQEAMPEVLMQLKGYRINMLATNLEFALGKTLFRAEAAYVKTKESNSTEYIPFSEVLWVTGIEPSTGDFRILFEYMGKHIIDYYDPLYDPVLPDLESFSGAGQLSPEEIEVIIREQTASFNRLYNYQLNQYAHSVGFRLAYDNNISILKPELNLIYNISCNELFVNARIVIKPIDNLSIMLGTDIYHGKDNSLFDMINEELTSISLGMRVDF